MKFKDYDEVQVSLVMSFCRGCANLKTKRTGKHLVGVRCDVFVDPFPLWGGTDTYCWAGTQEKGYAPTQEEIKSCYKEDVHRPLLKPGGGDKQDRTHKLFGKERMKDNRYKPPWEGFIK